MCLRATRILLVKILNSPVVEFALLDSFGTSGAMFTYHMPEYNWKQSIIKQPGTLYFIIVHVKQILPLHSQLKGLSDEKKILRSWVEKDILFKEENILYTNYIQNLRM
jgi:hypothetical protein